MIASLVAGPSWDLPSLRPASACSIGTRLLSEIQTVDASTSSSWKYRAPNCRVGKGAWHKGRSRNVLPWRLCPRVAGVRSGPFWPTPASALSPRCESFLLINNWPTYQTRVRVGKGAHEILCMQIGPFCEKNRMLKSSTT